MDWEQRILNVYCAGYQSAVDVEATMSDNSAPTIVRWWDASGTNVTLDAASLTYCSIHLLTQPVGGGQMQLSWPVGALQEAPTVTGPWTTDGASSPCTFTPTGGVQKFFRVLVQ